ncbi:alpha/beta fold hydrolase [Chamaesiphon sp.]|uniref:alpha/beta fold hydrolase n=1 Tax=Chamaesiphon sp. TaxID=2814140 RepID=UPI0035948CAA
MAKITKNTIKVGALEWFYGELAPVGGDSLRTVIFLHGLPAQSLTWTGLMPPLAEQGIRSIAPDWIGFGNSSKPDQRDFDYTPDAFVTALSELVNSLKVDRFSLVVQGFLGTAGIQYALRNSDRVDRLVILNAPLTTGIKLPWQLRQLGLPVAGEMLVQDPLSVERTLEAGCKQVIEDQYLEAYRKPYLKSSAPGRALLATIRNLRLGEVLPEIAAGLPTLDIPIQVIWGAADPWLDLAQAEACVKSMQQGELVTLPTAAHYPQEHWYAQMKAPMMQFLCRQI